MKLHKKQQGVTMITIALGLVLLAFFVLIAVTLFPVYMENFNVSSHVSKLSQDANTKELTRDEVRTTLLRRFGIDDVKNVNRDDITISEVEGGGYEIDVEYEVRKEFMGNVDLVIYFHNVGKTR